MTIVYKNPYPPGKRNFHEFYQSFQQSKNVLRSFISEAAGRSTLLWSRAPPALTAATLTELSDRLISCCTAL